MGRIKEYIFLGISLRLLFPTSAQLKSNLSSTTDTGLLSTAVPCLSGIQVTGRPCLHWRGLQPGGKRGLEGLLPKLPRVPGLSQARDTVKGQLWTRAQVGIFSIYNLKKQKHKQHTWSTLRNGCVWGESNPRAVVSIDCADWSCWSSTQ